METTIRRRIPITGLGDALRAGCIVIGVHKDLTPEQNSYQALVDEAREHLLNSLDLALDRDYAGYRVRTTHFNEFVFERDGKAVCRHEIEALVVQRP
jgi:hypothetical protein